MELKLGLDASDGAAVRLVQRLSSPPEALAGLESSLFSFLEMMYAPVERQQEFEPVVGRAISHIITGYVSTPLHHVALVAGDQAANACLQLSTPSASGRGRSGARSLGTAQLFPLFR